MSLPYHLIEISSEAAEKLVPDITWPWDTSASYFTGDLQGEKDVYRCYLAQDSVIVVLDVPLAIKAQYVFKYDVTIEDGYT